MNVLRQNTDYALRLLVNLADRFNGKPAATNQLAQAEDISPQFAAKILQKLQKAHLVASVMGPQGGFVLARRPAKINLLQAIQAVQGMVAFNRCSPGAEGCRRKKYCPIAPVVDRMQNQINDSLASITLQDLLDNAPTKGADVKKNKSGNKTFEAE